MQQTAALLAALGFLVIAVFQLALALGAPLGRAAWGGRSALLPARLRVASSLAVFVWLLAAIVVLGAAGLGPIALPAPVTDVGPWVLVVVLLVGAVMNFASSSQWERYGWAPLALVLAGLTFLVMGAR